MYNLHYDYNLLFNEFTNLNFLNTTVRQYLIVNDAALRPSEEAFAAFAGDDAVVKARGLVLADVADQRLLVLRGRDQQRGRSVLKKNEVRLASDLAMV